jgi:dihydrodipicolinate synthase/N-acetylneuraminate lyase
VSERQAPPGILCALITPFDDEGSPDPIALDALVDFQIDRGMHGLFVLGTTGEGPLLDPGERRRVAEMVVERAGGRIPVVIHCGAPDTKTTAGLARHAQDIGADAVAVVAPYYFKYGESALYRHFADVAEAAPRLGLYVYENPGLVGYSAGVRLVTRLVNEVPNILGVKDTGDSIGKLAEYLTQPGRPPEVYTGNNATVLPALVMGARGAVSALANAVPELIAGVYASWSEGRVDDSRAMQFSLARILGSLEGMPFVGGVKHLVDRRGLVAGGTRAPQSLLTASQAAEVDRRLSLFEDVAPWLEPLIRT